jgi:RNA polymerase sigma factor (sigma-70 family)
MMSRPALSSAATNGTASKTSITTASQARHQRRNSVDIRPYLNLVERVARVEYKRIPQHMVDYEELVSIGALAIQALLQNKTQQDIGKLNISYMATATRWAIRNELRTRFKWYSMKQKSEGEELLEDGTEASGAEGTVREAVYQTILSIDSMNTSEDGETTYDSIADQSATPEEALEITELGRAIKAAIEALPAKDRHIVECRFYKNMQVKEIAAEVNLSSSRITRIIQAALQTVRVYLQEQRYITPEQTQASSK